MRTNNKTAWDVVEERDAHYARLLNFKNGTKIELFWGLNEAMERDQMVLLKVGKEEVIINAEEMRRFLRWV